MFWWGEMLGIVHPKKTIMNQCLFVAERTTNFSNLLRWKNIFRRCWFINSLVNDRFSFFPPQRWETSALGDKQDGENVYYFSLSLLDGSSPFSRIVLTIDRNRHVKIARSRLLLRLSRQSSSLFVWRRQVFLISISSSIQTETEQRRFTLLSCVPVERLSFLFIELAKNNIMTKIFLLRLRAAVRFT